VPRVVIEPHAAFEVAAGTTLLDASEHAGVALDCECGGVAACNSCRVQVLEGAANLSPMLDEERPFLDADDQRLGCQAAVLGDVRVRPVPGL
jgi:adenylate cyclase